MDRRTGSRRPARALAAPEPPDPSAVVRALIRQERALVGARVLAPVERGGRIRVDVAGLAWECPVEGSFAGWGVFELLPTRRARMIREAEPWERAEYARRYPAPPLVLCAVGDGGTGRAVDGRAERSTAVRLVEGVEVFERIRTAWDGARHWLVGRDPRCDPRRAFALRQALARGLAPDELEALSPAWRRIYAAARRFAGGDRVDRRLERALGVSGARLVTAREVQPGVLDVAWERGQVHHATRVRAADLTVLSAGICLSGRDQQFDLASIVGVMAEAPEAWA